MRMLAAAVLFCVISEGCALGQSKTLPSFDVTVIRPAKPDEHGRGWDSNENLTKITNYTVSDLIRSAFNLKSESQLLNAPDWASREHYDLTAKISPEELRRIDALPRDKKREEYLGMLQSMLAERFGLHVERSSRLQPRLAMERVSTKDMGPALQMTPAGPDGEPVGGTNSSRNSGPAKVDFTVAGLSMDELADRLSGMSETGRRMVVNRTGLPGFFNFKLTYAPDSGMGVSPEATLPGLIDTLREQLGLKLVKEEGDVPVVIVVAAQKPELD